MNTKPGITVGKRRKKYLTRSEKQEKGLNRYSGQKALNEGFSFEKNGNLGEYRFLPREWHSGRFQRD